MESMLLCFHFRKGAIREDGIVVKCKVYLIQGALAHTEGVITLCLGLEVMNQGIFCSAWSKFNT